MVTGAYFPEMSGAGLQCRELVRAVRGYVTVAVLTTTTDRTLPSESLVDGVPVYRVYVDPARAWTKLTAALRMTWVFLRERRHHAILHLHGFSQKSILLVMLALLTRARLAIKMTSVGHDDAVSMRTRGRVAYWCFSRARAFFGVSPRFRALYAESSLPEERFRLIPNGVDLKRFRPATEDERRVLRRELGFHADAFIVIFVGFFSREKCPDLLFTAWSKVARREAVPSALVFVGATRSTYYEVDRTLATEIRSQAVALGLEHWIHCVEATAEIEKYYRAADVFAMPSVREGLPNALLEAMACGKACVVTRLEGVTDTLIEDGVSGLLVPPRDEAALEGALAGLMQQPDKVRKMGARARERVSDDFAITDTARAYVAAYKELAAS